MKIFLILILIFFINIYKTVAEEPVGTTVVTDLPGSLAVEEPANDSVKYESKQRFSAPGKPYMIQREFVKDPVKHYRQEIRNEY